MGAQKIEETEGREAKWHGLPAHGPALDFRTRNKSRLLWNVRIPAKHLKIFGVCSEVHGLKAHATSFATTSER